MRTFLFLLLLLTAAAAGYEYFQHTQEVASYAEQRAHFGPSLASLKAKNQAQLEQNNALTTKLALLQAQSVQLKEQISAAGSPPSTGSAGTTPPPSIAPLLAPPAGQ